MIRGLPGKIRLSLRSPLAIFSSLSRTTTTITEEEARGRDKFLPILPGGVERGNSPFLHHPLFLTTPLSPLLLPGAYNRESRRFQRAAGREIQSCKKVHLFLQ